MGSWVRAPAESQKRVLVREFSFFMTYNELVYVVLGRRYAIDVITMGYYLPVIYPLSTRYEPVIARYATVYWK